MYILVSIRESSHPKSCIDAVASEKKRDDLGLINGVFRVQMKIGYQATGNTIPSQYDKLSLAEDAWRVIVGHMGR